jgi:hypothetical protein
LEMAAAAQPQASAAAIGTVSHHSGVATRAVRPLNAPRRGAAAEHVAVATFCRRVSFHMPRADARAVPAADADISVAAAMEAARGGLRVKVS